MSTSRFQTFATDPPVPWPRFEVAPKSELPHIRRSILAKIEAERRRLRAQKFSRLEASFD